MINLISGRIFGASVIASVTIALWVPGISCGQSPAQEGKIYWTGLEIGIHRSSLDGTNHEQLVKPEWSYPGDIALDVPGNRMYWADRRVSGVYRSGLDGTDIEILAGEWIGFPKWIESPLGDGWIYLGEGWGLLDRAGFLEYNSWTTSIALDLNEGKMYLTRVINHGDYLDGVIARQNLDGSSYEILVYMGVDYAGLEGIALDLVGGKMYWTEHGTISGADLNGQNVRYGIILQNGATVRILPWTLREERYTGPTPGQKQ